MAQAGVLQWLRNIFEERRRAVPAWSPDTPVFSLLPQPPAWSPDTPVFDQPPASSLQPPAATTPVTPQAPVAVTTPPQALPFPTFPSLTPPPLAEPPRYIRPTPPPPSKIPPWVWAVLGFMLTAGGRRAAPALLAAPFQAKLLADQAAQESYQQALKQALDEYELALREWQIGEQQATRRFELEQRAALEQYRQQMRAWLAQQENALREALQTDKQRFQLQLKELDLAARRELAEGRDATQIQQTMLRALLAAANNPNFTATDRQQYMQMAHYLAQVGTLPDVIPSMQPSLPEQLLPQRQALMEAQTGLAQARTQHTLADIARVRAQAQYLLKRAQEIGQRNHLIATRPDAILTKEIQQQFISLRNNIAVYGQLANRALIGYQQAVREGNQVAAQFLREQYDQYVRALQAEIDRLAELQRITGIQLTNRPDSNRTPQAPLPRTNPTQGLQTPGRERIMETLLVPTRHTQRPTRTQSPPAGRPLFAR